MSAATRCCHPAAAATLPPSPSPLEAAAAVQSVQFVQFVQFLQIFLNFEVSDFLSIFVFRNIHQPKLFIF